MGHIMDSKKLHLMRHSELINPKHYEQSFTIIGAGAIGSFLALQLVKTGFEKIVVYDFDSVSVENMSCQFYRFKDIGNNKAKALQDLIHDFTEVKIAAIPEPWTKDSYLGGIVIAAADSMQVRKEIFEQACATGKRFFIDSRMGAESCAIYCIDLHDSNKIELYKNTLYSDAEAVQERCTAKATVYTANLTSGLMVNYIKKILMGESFPVVTLWNIAKNDLNIL